MISHFYTADIDGSNRMEFTDAIKAAGANPVKVTYLLMKR